MDRAALDELIVAHLPMVKSLARRIARRLSPGRMSREDLIGWGSVELVEAARRYVPGSGDLSGYLKTCVRYAMFRAIENHGTAIAVPDNIHKLRARSRKGTLDGATAERRRNDLADASRVMDGVRDPRKDDTRNLRDGFADIPDWLPTSCAWATDTADLVSYLLGLIGDRQRVVIRLRYGLDGRGERKYREIASTLGVSERRVVQIEDEAIGEMREAGGRSG